MSERRPGGFSEDTAATPLVNLANERNVGPRRPCLVVVAGPRLGEIFPIDGELIIGREPEAQLRLPDDEGVSRRHARVVRSGDQGALIADLGSANGVFVDGDKINERLLVDGAKIRVGQTTVLKFTLYDSVEETAQRQLLEAALRDGVTRAFNKRYFLQRLGAEQRYAERHKQPLALILIDIDEFSDLNAQHGQSAGDEVLRRLAEVLTSTLRAEDVLARYAGDQFAVVVRGISDSNAHSLADRLRKVIGAADVGPADESLSLTVSVGLATLGDGPPEPVENLIARADAALQRAKQAGPNSIAG